MNGFIIMGRATLDHPLLKNGDRFRAWFWIVSKACWKPTPYDVNGKVVVIERGQLCASRSQLAEAWGWSPSAVERFLTRLETEQMIGRVTGQGRTIIKVCNYAKYQDIKSNSGQATGQATGQRSDSDRTAKEQGNKGTIGDTNVSPPLIAPPPKRGKKWTTIDRPEGVSPGTWRDFEDHRKLKGAPISDTVVNGFRREAGRVGWTLEAAIIESIERGWQGFKADWVKEKSNGQTYGRGGGNGNDRRSTLARVIDEGLDFLDGN